METGHALHRALSHLLQLRRTVTPCCHPASTPCCYPASTPCCYPTSTPCCYPTSTHAANPLFGQTRNRASKQPPPSHFRPYPPSVEICCLSVCSEAGQGVLCLCLVVVQLQLLQPSHVVEGPRRDLLDLTVGQVQRHQLRHHLEGMALDLLQCVVVQRQCA